jgi:hypothetical protein
MSSRPANDLASVQSDGFFTDPLLSVDPEVADAI